MIPSDIILAVRLGEEPVAMNQCPRKDPELTAAEYVQAQEWVTCWGQNTSYV